MRHKPLPRLAALWVVLPALALALTAPACSDDDGGVCDDVVNACDAVDDISCLGNTAQTCTENADGCLEWTDTEDCGTNATCTDGECLCNDVCTIGDSQCDGNMIQLCAEDADGCYSWTDDTDCANTGESCDDTADAICVSGAGCGNDVIEGTELCDGTDLDGVTCEDQNFGGGTLACNATCDAYITTGCTAASTCGNDLIEGSEVCDGSDLDSQDCTDHGFDGGTLDCNTNCGAFDTSACTTIPPASTCANATDLSNATFPVTLTGTFDDDPAAGFSCDATPTNVVWYQYTPTTTGNYVIDAATADTDAWAQLAVTETNACNPYGTEVTCVLGEDYFVSTVVTLTSGVTYLIAVFTDDEMWATTDPEIDITYVPPTPGDACANPSVVTGATFPYQLTGNFGDDPATGFSCNSTPTNMVWYEYTATTTAWHYILTTNNTATSAWSGLVVLDGTGCSPYDSELACNAFFGGLNADAVVNMTADATYLIGFFTDDNDYTMVDPVIDISVIPPATIDWCNVQFPTTETIEEGQFLTIYGRLFSSGLTNLTTGIDWHPGLVAQVGVGPDGSDPLTDPSLFVWNTAQPNVGVAANDEYMADIIVPPSAGSPYDFAYRFSGDGGATWTYCDRTDSTYHVSDAGELISTATTVTTMPTTLGDVVITEVMQNPDVLSDANGEWFELYNTTGNDFNLAGCVISDAGADSHTIVAPFIVPAASHATAARAADPGFTPGYVYSGITLGNTADELYITCGGTLIAGIDYDGGSVWPDPTGASMSLDSGFYDETSNDDGTNWCEGSESYNGDLATPNRANPTCP